MKRLFLIPLMACMMCVSMVAQNVAKIGETEYATLNAAFDAIPNGGTATIVLIDNATLTQGIVIGKRSSDALKSITLDINGHEISSSTVADLFTVYGGALKIINSVPGVGSINNNNPARGSGTNVIHIYGTAKKESKPRSADINDLHSYVLVDKGVNLTSWGVGITINAHRAIISGTDTINRGTWIYGAKGVANGVRLDVQGSINAYKYCIKPNGTLGYPEDAYKTYFNEHKKEYYANPASVTMSVADTAFAPYIHVFPTAVLTADPDNSEAVAAYCSGYANWLIEGKCTGATGVYAKSGDVIIKDALVESTWSQAATMTAGGVSGVDAGGNAVVVESNKAYSGHTKITVAGDSKVSTEAAGGSALIDVLKTTETNTSKIESITIDGGSFTGDNAIIISEETVTSQESVVTVNGITIQGDVTVGENGSGISDIINTDKVHTTEVVVDGKTTTIISDGAAPTEYADFDAAVAAAAADPTKNIKWTGIATVEIGDAEGATSVSKTLPELQMVSGSAGNLQQIIVHKNSELHIRHLIMNDFARIDVKAGGKLIVEGEQGMNAPSKENILIETSEANPAYFMFNPAVTSNKHPLAKVQMWSKGYQRNPGDFVWQRFGMPGWSTDVRLLDVDFDAPTYAFSVNTDKTPINDWSIMGWYDTFKPFGSYILSTTNGAPGDIYTFACPMVGNENAVLGLYSHYNYFANSYTAPIDIWTLISDFEEKYPNVDATIYLYDPQTDYWSDINFATLLTEDDCPTTIEPMFAFILVATPSVSPVIDYKAAIWDPIMNPSTAPARRQGAQFSTARIEIVAEDGTADHVNLVEGNQFTAAYDNAYDAEKLTIGERTFLYANGCRDKMGVVATDNLEGTLLSMNTTDQTSFTMQFNNVNGLNYAVRDMLTGTETEIVEGATYMFSVPADATVEGRFKIVAVNKVPTAIENTEVENTEKGIYNMAGQYVGTDFHILPAGVYVVDGKKIVK